MREEKKIYFYMESLWEKRSVLSVSLFKAAWLTRFKKLTFSGHLKKTDIFVCFKGTANKIPFHCGNFYQGAR